MSRTGALTLTIERLPSAESGAGRALVAPEDLARAGLDPEMIVELVTRRGRRLLARLGTRADPKGAGIVRLDRYQLRFLKPDLHESVTLTQVYAPEATRVVLEPAGVDPASYRGIRAADVLLPKGAPWQDAASDLLVARR